MTLPASGTISMASVNAEMGRSGSTSLSFINDNVKAAYRNRYSLSSLYSYAWFQKNNAQNCSNGNCGNCSMNCGDLQCRDCYNCYSFDCLNCDSRAWLQPNCNCMSNCIGASGQPFQCNACGQVTYNCNCNCDCSNC